MKSFWNFIKKNVIRVIIIAVLGVIIYSFLPTQYQDMVKGWIDSLKSKMNIGGSTTTTAE